MGRRNEIRRARKREKSKSAARGGKSTGSFSFCALTDLHNSPEKLGPAVPSKYETFKEADAVAHVKARLERK